MAIVNAIDGLASLSSDQGRYLSRILEAGLHDLEKLDFQNVPDAPRAAFREKVKARNSDPMTTIP